MAEGRLTFSLFDDAMISMSYARNLAAGHGLVWMPGASPVEGYTNLLWTLVMALPHLAGLPDRLTSLPILLLGAVLLCLTSALAVDLARRAGASGTAALLAGAATALSYPLVFWTLRGLEVGLIACLVAGACLLVLRLAERPSARDLALLCGALVLAVLTRTDALIFAAVVLGFLALSSRRHAALGALATAATLAAHTAFRVAYYGAALPNTYTLKVSGHPLAERLARGGGALLDLLSSTLWAPAALLLALLLVKRSSLGRPAQLLVAIVAAALAYSVWVGGDVWEFADFANRFVAVTLPALFVIALLGIETLLEARGREAWLGLAALAAGFVAFTLAPAEKAFADARQFEAYAAAAVLGLFSLPSLGAVRLPSGGKRTGVLVLAALLLIASANGRSLADWVRNGGLHVKEDENMVRRALAVRAVLAPDARIAVVWAGAIPYFSRLESIDLFGKNDPAIARLAPRGRYVPGHDKRDYAYSIGRTRPELVALYWPTTPREREQLAAWGYEKVEGYWLRRDVAIDRSRLRARAH